MNLGDLAASDRVSNLEADRYLVGAWDLAKETSFALPFVSSVSGGLMTPAAWNAMSRSSPTEAQKIALLTQVLGDSDVAQMLGEATPSQAEKEAAAAQMGVPALSAAGEVVGPIIPRTGTYAELKDVELAVGEIAIITDHGVNNNTGWPSTAVAKSGVVVLGANDVSGDPLTVKELPWQGVDVFDIADAEAPGALDPYHLYSNCPVRILNISGASSGRTNHYVYWLNLALDDGAALTGVRSFPGFRTLIKVQGSGVAKVKSYGTITTLVKDHTAATNSVLYDYLYGKVSVGNVDTTSTELMIWPTGANFNHVAVSAGTTGGSGSAGAGNQHVEVEINGTVYKLLHDN